MITLLIGGARSGKSAVAERIASDAAGPGGVVTYVATMEPRADDPDLTDRLDLHRARRPAGWRTVEPPYDLATVLASTSGTVLVDSLGPWVAALPDMHADTEALTTALRARTGATVLVSDEVGWGVHPETASGRLFRDAVGRLNQALAAVADETVVVVAGRLLRTEAP